MSGKGLRKHEYSSPQRHTRPLLPGGGHGMAFRLIGPPDALYRAVRMLILGTSARRGAGDPARNLPCLGIVPAYAIRLLGLVASCLAGWGRIVSHAPKCLTTPYLMFRRVATGMTIGLHIITSIARRMPIQSPSRQPSRDIQGAGYVVGLADFGRHVSA